jgi:hypothetical protein
MRKIIKKLPKNAKYVKTVGLEAKAIYYDPKTKTYYKDANVLMGLHRGYVKIRKVV